jgi:3-oxoacyl-[acyl-carrier-protein] synthase-3
MLGVAPDWIEANSGIRERRWVDADQATSDLGVAAVRDAVSNASTLSPDYQVPGIAPVIQRKLDGCGNIPAIDLRAGCASILYSLQLGRGLIESRTARTIVCCAAEAQSKGLDLDRRSADLSMLFGDGAGAFVLSGEPKLPEKAECVVRIDDILIETDGSFAQELIVRAPGTANGPRWLDAGQLATGLQCGSMQGRTVILQAVRKLADVVIRITRRNDVGLDEIDVFIPHQANANLLRALAKRLSISDERVVSNLEYFGNTSSASAFLALWQAHRDRRFRPGSFGLILAFGAGFTWGAALCRAEGSKGTFQNS